MDNKTSLFSNKDIIYTDKAENKRMRRDFLSDDNFARKLIVEFSEYLLDRSPEKFQNTSIDMSFLLRKFQDNYKYLSETEGWSSRMVRTIVWNICLNKEDYPFSLYTFFKYEEDYYNSKLVPYDCEDYYE